MVTDMTEGWGTWEELLLGGAVLRYGTRDWNLVASELRARTSCPQSFTPKVCKAKYEDLKKRYSGSTAMFEELRKKRVAELKRALEQSEDSIGSLELKLESLKAEKIEKRDDGHIDNGSGGPESDLPLQKLDRIESSPKEMSKDGLSAGSFTHETRTNWFAEEMETKPEISESSEQGKILNVEDKLACACYEGQGGTFRKRRGKRKRKDCSKSIKEVSVGESDFWGSSDVMSLFRENSISNCGEVVKSSGVENQKRSFRKDAVDDLMEILDSVLENKGASAFRGRLDSQKRGRYKKMIRQHMDFDTIRSRISSQTIRSRIELFRDLLLLTNNSLVFYSKNTREYKFAQLLRDIVTKKMRVDFKGFSRKVTKTNSSTKLPVHNPTVKPKSARPGNQKPVAKAVVAASNSASGASRVKKPGKADSSPSVESSPAKTKGIGRAKKVGRRTGGQKPGPPLKKRVRSK